MRPVTIYGLCSSEEGVLRYVGQTSNPVAYRLNAHINEATKRPKKTHLHHWINKCISSGETIVYLIIEENAERNAAEIKWIAHYRSNGYDLVNTSNGGDGFAGPKSEQHKRNISSALKGKSKSKEHKAAVSAALKGVPLSLERAIKLAEARKKRWFIPSALGLKHSEESKKKISGKNKGKKRTDETRAKMREASKARWTDEARQEAARKAIAAWGNKPCGMTGRKHSEEAKLKMSLTRKLHVEIRP